MKKYPTLITDKIIDNETLCKSQPIYNGAHLYVIKINPSGCPQWKNLRQKYANNNNKPYEILNVQKSCDSVEFDIVDRQKKTTIRYFYKLFIFMNKHLKTKIPLYSDTNIIIHHVCLAPNEVSIPKNGMTVVVQKIISVILLVLSFCVKFLF